MTITIRRPLVIGIHLLITSQISYSLVLLSANIEDVKRLAMQFVPEPLAEQIAKFLSKATFIKTPSASSEAIRNGLAKLSYINWNDAEQRGILETSDEDRYRNHISVKRGRDIPPKTAQETTTRPTFVDRKKNYVYDYALKQGNTKKPNFEWQKGANYDIAVLTNQGPMFDTTAAYSTEDTTKSRLKISHVSKPINAVEGLHSKVDVRRPIRKPMYPMYAAQKTEKDVYRPTKEKYPNFVKLQKLAKKERYSNAEIQRPGREKPRKILTKQIRKPAKDKPYANVGKEILRPAKEYPRYKEVISEPTKLDIKVKVHKPAKPDTPETKEQSKEENVIDTDSDDNSDINKVLEVESSDSYRAIDSTESIGSTRFVDYERSNTVQYQSEKSIYTKDSKVLATSGPVELLRASVNFLVTSEENSLNAENKKYFKQYDIEPRPDIRRHLEEKSGDEETTTATTQTEETKADTEGHEVTTVATEGPDAKGDEDVTEDATVNNNEQTEQVTEITMKEESK